MEQKPRNLENKNNWRRTQARARVGKGGAGGREIGQEHEKS